MDMILLNDGTIEYVADIRDFTELVEEYMGTDARRWLAGFLQSIREEYGVEVIEDFEGEMNGEKAHHKKVMRKLRGHSETIAGLIGKEEIDRIALSKEAGAIGIITWREMNR